MRLALWPWLLVFAGYWSVDNPHLVKATASPDWQQSATYVGPPVAQETAATLVDGRCSICVKEGQRSTVSVGLGSCSRTLIGFSPYYDADGHFHSDDPNVTTCHYRCSRGHLIVTKE